MSAKDVSSGLKAALKKGITSAVRVLGATNGFYHNKRFRIQMPDELRKVAKTLNKFGKQKYVRRFSLAMN